MANNPNIIPRLVGYDPNTGAGLIGDPWTVALQTVSGIFWYKFGPGVTDWAPITGANALPRVTVYEGNLAGGAAINTTHTTLAYAKFVDVWVFGAGGGGGSGARGGGGTSLSGGAGGGAGGISFVRAQQTGATSWSYFIAAPGAGGPGVSADGPGVTGGTASQSYAFATGYIGLANGGAAGGGQGGQVGGNSTAGFGSVSATQCDYQGRAGGGGVSGAAGGNGGPALDSHSGTGGGAGGGINSVGPTAFAGGNGGVMAGGFSTVVGGAINTDGVLSLRPNASQLSMCGAQGSSGGGSSVTGNGGSGPNNITGYWGAGGGGGGACLTGFTSGSGGNGGPGAVVFFEW